MAPEMQNFAVFHGLEFFTVWSFSGYGQLPLLGFKSCEPFESNDIIFSLTSFEENRKRILFINGTSLKGVNGLPMMERLPVKKHEEQKASDRIVSSMYQIGSDQRNRVHFSGVSGTRRGVDRI